MCGRIAMPGRYDIMQRYDIHNVGQHAPMEHKRMIYVPGVTVHAIVSHRGLRLLTGMRWGFGEVYNARMETIREKSFWAESYEKRRMIFPIDAFFERHWFISKEPMAVAGIYRMVTNNGPKRLEAAMITMASEEPVRKSHPRMPVLVKDIDNWLSGAKDIESVMREDLQLATV